MLGVQRVLVAACVASLAACGGEPAPADPGRITLHRLNNAEYDNTVRDLLGTSLRPAADFPADDRGYGFDNVADVLRVSPLSVELYEAAAEALVADALAVTTPSTTRTFELMTGTDVGTARGTGWLFYAGGSASVTVSTPLAGSYRIGVRAYGDQAGPDPARVVFEVPGQPQVVLDVPATQASPQAYATTFVLPAGAVAVSVGFANDYYDPALGDRNLWIDHLVVEGPLDAPQVDGERRRRILVCEALGDAACQEQILRAFTRRAWRRPPTDAEIAGLRALVELAVSEGDPPETGLRLALQQVLVSPHFLFRVELDPAPDSLVPHRLTGWELASRLSYFLWSTMPDEALFEAAASGALVDDPGELERQIRRMLDDPKAIALVDNFAGQWLYTRALGDQDPDYQLFPEYDDALEAAMRAETRRYVQAFLDEDLPMDEFLTAPFTFVNDRLAAHYGLPLPGTGEELVRVSLEGTPRRGFLTQGSFLRVTSRPKRTSPVVRGKWVLDNLLCTPPRAPPPGVEGLPEADVVAGSVRDRLEAHVTNPICASCHRVMDPLGFGLDQFDAIGRFRETDGGYPVDASGALADGTRFDGAIEMTAALAKDPEVYRCMVEKLYTYTGRSPYRIEAIEHIDALTARFAASGYSLRELIVAMTTHPFFVSRRGEP